MKASKINEWLQVIGSFGGLAGLILVALQIQQNTVLVRAELVSNASDAWINIDASKQSENFASVLAKSIVNPQELTTAESLELVDIYSPILTSLSGTAICMTWASSTLRRKRSFVVR